MADRSSTARLGKDFRSLWSIGAVGLKSDRDLLENYIQGGDKAELAFGALVERHGRTVLQVCRNVLGDCHLAADSFQVTFLILARFDRRFASRPARVRRTSGSSCPTSTTGFAASNESRRRFVRR